MSRKNFPHVATAARFPKGHPARKQFWDVEYREQEPSGRPLLGDERLCATVLIQAIQYAKGVLPNADKECVECHQKNHPHCYTEGIRNGESFVTRHDRGCKDFHTHRQCALRWLASDEEQPVGPLVNGKREYIAQGWTFITVCDFLSLEPSYLRRNLNRPECEAYWADEAKVNGFLEFFSSTQSLSSQAFGHTGSPSEEGEAD